MHSTDYSNADGKIKIQREAEKEGRKKDDSNIATGANYGRIVVLLHLRVGLSLNVIPKQASQALEGS